MNPVMKLMMGLILTIAFILLTAQPIVQNSDSICDTERFLTTREKRETITATRVYVHPFQGRHQVFGVFVVPKTLHKGAHALLQVKHAGVYCDVITRYGPAYEDITAPDDRFVMIDHIRTRSAIQLWLQGKLDDLNNPNDWTLTYKIN
jgi:hypothetical protein